MRWPRLLEAVGVGALGGGLATAGGSVVGRPIVCGAVGAINGAVSGWRGVYELGCSRGLTAVVLDSTWALPMTAAGVVANLVGSLSRTSGYVADLSHRQNRHVYRRGLVVRRGFAVTLGNVIGGAGDVDRPRRRRLVSDHEDVHIWQARWLGPLYPLLYGGWLLVGGAVGVVAALTVQRGERFTKVVETSAYYLNPLEWWAYSRDDHWPPSGKVAGMGWRRPCCRPLADVRPR